MVDTNAANIAITAIQALPGILAIIRGAHQQANPDGPPITEAQALAALHAAVQQSVGVDEGLRSKLDTGAYLPGGGAA